MSYRFESRPQNKLSTALGLVVTAALIVLPAPALGGSGGGGAPGAHAPPGTTPQRVGRRAGPPADAPRKVVRAIAAANRIVNGKPYCLGGGHAGWQSRCYDCSGSVSYALGKPGARVLAAPMPSGSFMRWEEPGKGKWITTYANSGHIYAVIAGLRLDTSMTDGDGPGWSTEQRSSRGFTARHPARL